MVITAGRTASTITWWTQQGRLICWQTSLVCGRLLIVERVAVVHLRADEAIRHGRKAVHLIEIDQHAARGLDKIRRKELLDLIEPLGQRQEAVCSAHPQAVALGLDAVNGFACDRDGLRIPAAEQPHAAEALLLKIGGQAVGRRIPLVQVNNGELGGIRRERLKKYFQTQHLPFVLPIVYI